MSQTIRHSYLDWLRIFAILGVLLFHSAMPFAAEESWHIKNGETSNLFLEFNFWLSRFRMPLLFFISGAVCYFMLQRRSAGNFVGLRFRRLFIPLIAGMLIVVPPQIYMERLTQGFQGNYWSFYPSIFNFIPYPQGNTSWHHLWFILYLFIYDIISVPFFKWMLSTKSEGFRKKLSWVGRGYGVYLFMVPSVLVFVLLIRQYPQTNDLIHDWAMLPYWFLFMLAGFIIITIPALLESLVKHRRFSFLLAFASIIIVNYLRWNNREPNTSINSIETFAYLSLYPLTAWTWVMTIIGYGRKYLDRPHSILEYANQAAYPFYILHQTVIVILAYYIVNVNESILSKYIFLVALSFAISMAIFHLILKPYKLTRFLFGMKAKKWTQIKDQKKESDVKPMVEDQLQIV